MVKITSQDQLNRIIESKIKAAVASVAKTFADNLQEIILSEYYLQYDPKSYKRTEQFFRSTLSKMLNDNTGMVYVDYQGLKYKDISGYEVVTFASMGFHGNYMIETPGHFWESFINLLNRTARPMLIDALKKQGLNIH